jgi:hypothetical protein
VGTGQLGENPRDTSCTRGIWAVEHLLGHFPILVSRNDRPHHRSCFINNLKQRKRGHVGEEDRYSPSFCPGTSSLVVSHRMELEYASHPGLNFCIVAKLRPGGCEVARMENVKVSCSGLPSPASQLWPKPRRGTDSRQYDFDIDIVDVMSTIELTNRRPRSRCVNPLSVVVGS